MYVELIPSRTNNSTSEKVVTEPLLIGRVLSSHADYKLVRNQLTLLSLEQLKIKTKLNSKLI